MNEYLNRVLIYLKQELPEGYRDTVKLQIDRIIITIPDDVEFDPTYAELYRVVVKLIDRVRKREYDLNFTMKSSVQLRDFKIIK
jgi:hypothetical protein